MRAVNAVIAPTICSGFSAASASRKRRPADEAGEVMVSKLQLETGSYHHVCESRKYESMKKEEIK
jgi:hypothetical protein